MNLVRTWIRPVYLAAYLAFLALAFGWLPPLSGGGRSSDLLFGHLLEPSRAALGASLAALFAALAVLLGAPRRPIGRALLLFLIGGALLLLGPQLSGATLPTGRTARLALAGLLLLPLVAFRRGEERNEAPRLVTLELGTALGGAGATVALLVLQSRLVLLGYGDAAELHLHALLLFGLAGVGAFGFGLPFARGGRTLAALAAVVSAGGALVGLYFLAPLATHNGLDAFLRHFGSDLSDVGRLEGGALIGARGLLVCAFGLGAVVAGLNSRRGLAALLIGVAAGRLAWPSLVAAEAADGAPRLALVALGLAALGALPLAWNRLHEAHGPARFGAATGLALVVAGALALPRQDAVALAPWLRFETTTLFASDDPLGYVSVQTTASGQPVLTIDGVTLTPDANQEAADAARLTAALDLMEANWKPDDPNPEVLLAGQLTLARLEAFSAWQAASGHDAHLSWSAPWEAHQAEIRPLLEESWALPDPLPFAEAEAKVGSGEIDLVIVPMAFGPEISSLSAAAPPRAAAPAVLPIWHGADANQPSVVWLSAEAPLAGAHLGTEVIFGGSDLDQLGIGLVYQLAGAPGRLWPTGASRSPANVLTRLAERPVARSLEDRSQLFARLASAGNDPFLAAVADLLAAQTTSSPWAAPLQRFELDSAALETLAAATTTPPGAFERLIWNFLAQVLRAKRMPAESLAVLPGLLERAGRWPELEYALARAELELMMTGEARLLLARLFAEERLGLVPLIEYGNCLGQDGDWALAAEVFGRARKLTPDDRGIERREAIAEARAGLPRAREHVQRLLDEDPDDAELALYLQPGPLPPAPPGFDPTPLRESHED